MNDTNVIQRLKELETDGELTPDAVLADAESVDSPLHGYFDWDDTSAAHKYRIDQARTLIRSVRVVMNETKRQVSSIAYVRNPDLSPKERGYISTLKLRSDKDVSRQALIRELERAEAALNRAYNIADALGLSKEVERLLAGVRGVRSAA